MSIVNEEWETHPLADKFLSNQNKLFQPELPVKIGAANCTLPKSYIKYIDSVENFHVRNEDIWIVTYPKSGTTWTQEMVWLLVNNLDYDGAKKFIDERSPFFEFTTLLTPQKEESAFEVEKTHLTSLEITNLLPSPRVIKTHLPYNLLPKEISKGEKKPKIVYVVREPKDACVSLYHHRALLEGYLGTLDDSVEEFVAGYCFYGSYWLHVVEFWERRDEPNILLIKYEDMKEDLSAVVEKVAKFLDKRITEEEKFKLVDHLSFDNMKNNEFVNYEGLAKLQNSRNGTEQKTNFFRKGIVGSWKEELSQKSVKLLNEWNSENCIDGLYPEIKL